MKVEKSKIKKSGSINFFLLTVIYNHKYYAKKNNRIANINHESSLQLNNFNVNYLIAAAANATSSMIKTVNQ